MQAFFNAFSQPQAIIAWQPSELTGSQTHDKMASNSIRRLTAGSLTLKNTPIFYISYFVSRRDAPFKKSKLP